MHEEPCTDPYARFCGQTEAAASSAPILYRESPLPPNSGYYPIGRGAGMYIIPTPLPHGECGFLGRAPIIKQGVFATIFTRITTAANTAIGNEFRTQLLPILKRLKYEIGLSVM